MIPQGSAQCDSLLCIVIELQLCYWRGKKSQYIKTDVPDLTSHKKAVTGWWHYAS